MSWKEHYQQHLMSAEEAVKHIQSGNRVVVAHACGEPSYLLDAMVANASAWQLPVPSSKTHAFSSPTKPHQPLTLKARRKSKLL